MNRLPRLRSALSLAAAAVLATTTLAACAGAGSGSGTGTSSGSAILTIQGDAGNPTLVENFNPFSTTQLEGTLTLIYELPWRSRASVDGSLHAVSRHRALVHQPDDAGLHHQVRRHVE